jgi:hypothetical protein
MSDYGKLPPIIGESNGHRWFNYNSKLVCCIDCGIVRRADDRNKQCPGKVSVSLREEAKLTEKAG